MARAAGQESTEVLRPDAVHVLLRSKLSDCGGEIVGGRERMLHDHAVHGSIVVEGADPVDEPGRSVPRVQDLLPKAETQPFGRLSLSREIASERPVLSAMNAGEAGNVGSWGPSLKEFTSRAIQPLGHRPALKSFGHAGLRQWSSRR
jgi:hypothetical protein